MSKRDDLIKRAEELQLEFKGNISNKNLAALIKEAEAQQDAPIKGGGAAGPEQAVQQDAVMDQQASPPPAASEVTASENSSQSEGAEATAKAGAELAGDVVGSASQDTQPATHGTGAAENAAAPTEASGLVVRVTGPKKGRRRAGYQFSKEPVEIPLADLTEVQQHQLITDPTLTLQLLQDGEPQGEPFQAGSVVSR